jgi:hypothetical protein
LRNLGLQGTGVNWGSRGPVLEAGERVFQKGDALRLLVEEIAQQQDERGALVVGDVGQRQRPAGIRCARTEGAAALPGHIEKLRKDPGCAIPV